MLDASSATDRLLEAFARQRTAFDSQGGLPLETRRAELKKLRALIKTSADDFAKAVSDDFGGRSRHETLIAEIGVLLGAIDHALPRLAKWAKPERAAIGWRF
jgi:coniferyl-aldehyde dehydrogenase